MKGPAGAGKAALSFTDKIVSHGNSSVGNVLEVHHVACIGSCTDATLPSLTAEQRALIKQCLAVTKWNINHAHDTIGLPRKWAYVRDPENASGWGTFPCHQVDHDLYRFDVNSYFKEHVWEEIARKATAKDCKDLAPDTLQKLLEAVSDEFKPKLQDRAAEDAFKFCRSGEVNAAKEGTWFIEFSMAKPMEARRRNKFPPAPNKTQRAGLLDIFNALRGS